MSHSTPASQYQLHVADLPPSPNQTRGQHWAVRKRANERTSMAVLGAWLKGGRPIASNRPAKVAVEIEAYGPPDDVDNRLARLKGMIDALVVLGALVDDSPRWVTYELPTRRSGRRNRPVCHVTITYGVAKVADAKGGDRAATKKKP